MTDNSNSVSHIIETGNRKAPEKYSHSQALLALTLQCIVGRGTGDGMEERSQQRRDSGNTQEVFMFKAKAAGCEPKNPLASRMTDKDCLEKEIIFISQVEQCPRKIWGHTIIMPPLHHKRSQNLCEINSISVMQYLKHLPPLQSSEQLA